MMKPVSHIRQTCHAVAMLLMAGMLLTACGQGPAPRATTADTGTGADGATVTNDGGNDTARVQSLLEQAARTSGAPAQKLQLDAAEILIRSKRTAVAKNLLDEMNPQALNGENLGRYSLLGSTLALAKGKTDSALRMLDNPRLVQQSDTLPVPMQVDLGDKRARALAQKGQHVASVQQRIFIAPLLTDPKRAARNQRAIWKSLSYLSTDELDMQLAQAGSQDYRGWLELMQVYKNSGGLDGQLAQLNAWLVKWPRHAAAQHMPQDLAIVRDVAAHTPRNIAVLLPFSGREKAVSDAIRDGFMAAHFQGTDANRPRITFYDTNAGNDFVAIYQRAVADGAEAIIGPLLKENVRALQSLPQLPVPTLALNTIDDNNGDAKTKSPANMFQFGLSLNEEATQVADIATAEQFKRAAIIGIRTDWATRAADNFKLRWLETGGTVVDEVWFPPTGRDFATSIEQMLAIDESRQRAKDLQRVLGKNVKFEPRRRQDIDVIFFVGKAEQARSIKPMMTYYYADAIPVYATSSIYSGIQDPARNQDLNGIRFSEIPWMLNDDDTLKQTVAAHSGNDSPFVRLYALGADAFHLYPRLRQLELFPNARLQGSTGELWVDQNRLVHRRMGWAEFRAGLAQPATVALGITDETTMQDAIDASSTLEEPEY